MAKTLSRERHFAQNPSTRFPVLGWAIALSLAFFALGTIFIPYAGIQNDEALFTNPIYQNDMEFGARALHHRIPLMILTYLGSLKTILYWPILRIFPASPYTVRLPVVLIGSITIFLFFVLADLAGTRKAAWAAAILLATDPTFLLTDTFDWGPVALDHFLLVTGTLALVQFARRGTSSEAWLAVGCFCYGLALWNKALFLWTLTGLVAALLMVFAGELRALWSPRRAGIVAAAFIIGASPFLLYNIRRHNETLRSSAKLEIPDWNAKFIQLRGALSGSTLFGYIVSEETRERPKAVASVPGKLALAVRQRLGEHNTTFGDYAMLACVLAVPLWWKSRAARFALVFLAVGWLMMAITKDAGGSAHHVVLLWPFPQLFMGITLAAVPGRATAGILTAGLVLSNLLVVNQYLLQMERNGPGLVFTDAIYGLANALRSYPAENNIYVTDWGMQNSLALLSRGRLKLDIAESDFISDDIGPDERKHIAKMAADRTAIFIGHVPGQEIFPGSRERVIRAAENAGLHKQVIQVIADSNGRPTFEIFRWAAG
jgi:hypothetical protein